MNSVSLVEHLIFQSVILFFITPSQCLSSGLPRKSFSTNELGISVLSYPVLGLVKAADICQKYEC